MEKKLEFLVTEDYDGLMLKAFLKYCGLSRREISRLKFNKGLFLNDISCRVTEEVHENDVVTLVFAEQDRNVANRIIDTPDIIYEDEDVVVVNKPSDMPSHPSHEHLEDDMGTLLQNYYDGKMKIRAVGRLDKDVTGIMIYAKNQPACARLSKQRESDILHKEYYAVVEGHFKEKKGTLRYYLAKVPNQKNRVVREDGQLCITEYEVVQEEKNASLVKIHLITGRTHQIRAGMAYFKHPLLGDTLYGGKDVFYRPALHCGYVSFQQPFTKKTIVLELPIPEDMKALLKKG